MNNSCVSFFVLICLFLFCGRADDLSEIKTLIQAHEYDAAIEKLDVILEKDGRNIEANELRIRATMLQKSTLRNQKVPVSVPVKKDGSGPLSGKTAGSGFSIMSLCGDENTQSLSQIQQKLGIKKVN